MLAGISNASDAGVYQNGAKLYDLNADGRQRIPARTIAGYTYYIGDRGFPRERVLER